MGVDEPQLHDTAAGTRSTARSRSGPIGKALLGLAWVQKQERRRWIIYSLVSVALLYVCTGTVLALTDEGWGPSDTFSMVAGVLFFVIGASLAVAHELRQEAEERILASQSTLLRDQRAILDIQHETLSAVQHDVRRVVDAVILDNVTNAPSDLGRLVHLSDAPVRTEGAVSLAPSTLSSGNLELNRSPGLTEGIEKTPAEAVNRIGEFGEDPDVWALGQRVALEKAIEAAASESVVRALLHDTHVFALGEAAGDTTVAGLGTESDLLHFTVDRPDGREQVMLPIFTKPDVMRNALLRNPDWQSLSILELDGGALLANADSDVVVVVNPWGGSDEFQLPPEHAD